MREQHHDITSFRRALLTISVMLATVMQALDTTIANVALPYMQGALSTTQDQINWVLTSYIVASAIMTSPLGWGAQRFGAKRLFIVCTAGFTAASMLCGFALNIEQMVAYRLLQGVFGAALVPLSQTVLLDIYPPAKRGSAMAIWGMGVMLGPIMGPTLGGWLTDQYSWRWVFFVNLPFGILTVLGLIAFMHETPIVKKPFSWMGFLPLSLGIGSLQMMLDRGQEQGWFESSEIVAEAVLSAAGFYFFLADAATTKRPFIPMKMFRDRNFSVAIVFMFIVGVILLGSTAVITPFIQNLMGYPVLTSGYLLGARGIGTLFSMMFVGRVIAHVDARLLVGVGLTLLTGSLYTMVGWTEQAPASLVAITTIIQGVGMGLVFVPLNTIAFATMRPEWRTDGAAAWTLIRNIGSSVGISIIIARLTDNISVFHSQLVEFLTPFNDALTLPNAVSHFSLSTPSGLASLDAIVNQQAAVMSYTNDFLFMTLISAAAFPLLMLLQKPKPAAHAPGKPQESHAAVMD